MARRPVLHERIRATISTAARCAPSPEAFGTAVLQAVQELVPYDSARMFGIDPGSLLLNRLIAATESDEPYRGYWLRNIYLAGADGGYFAPHHLLRSGSGAMTYLPAQDDCWGLPDTLRMSFTPSRHTSSFHTTLTPIGGSMRLGLRARGQWIGLIDVVRREAGRPFAATEFSHYRELGRPIAQGLDTTLLREAAIRPNDSTATGSGVVYVAADRRISLQTPAADRWIAAMHDGDQAKRGELCTPLATIVSAFLSPEPHAAALTMTVASTAGPLRVEATAGQGAGEIAIVIAPMQAPCIVQAPTDWPLTERQRAIAALVLQGQSTKEIARALGIGVPTVETHLGRIYETLDVGGRHELLARYFRTVIRPRLDAHHPAMD